jgi:hypothetical protein
MATAEDGFVWVFVAIALASFVAFGIAFMTRPPAAKD